MPVEESTHVWRAFVQDVDEFRMVKEIMFLGDGGGEECGGSIG